MAAPVQFMDSAAVMSFSFPDERGIQSPCGLCWSLRYLAGYLLDQCTPHLSPVLHVACRNQPQAQRYIWCQCVALRNSSRYIKAPTFVVRCENMCRRAHVERLYGGHDLFRDSIWIYMPPRSLDFSPWLYMYCQMLGRSQWMLQCRSGLCPLLYKHCFKENYHTAL